MKALFIFLALSGFFLFNRNQILSAQEKTARFQKIGDYENLSFQQTRCLYQDSRGLVWIGTWGGLDRWDGSRIKSYTRNPFDSTGLQTKGIDAIVEDNDNNLWLGGDGSGLIRFDLEHESFQYLHPPDSFPSRNTNYLKFDPEGLLWMGTADGLIRYDPDKDRYKHIPVQDSLFEEIYLKGAYLDPIFIGYDSTGILWAAFDLGLYWYDEKEGVLIPQRFDLPAPAETDDLPFYYPYFIRDATMDEQGIIWMLMGKSELVRFNPYDNSVRFIWPLKFELPPQQFATGAIEVDSDGKIWFGWQEGLHVYDPVTGEVQSYDGLPRPAISDILADRDGNIFVAHWLGVDMLDKQGSELIYIDRKDLGLAEFKGTITDFLPNDNYYWISTYGSGIVKKNIKTQEIEYYTSDNTKNNISSNFTFHIFEDNFRQIWAVSIDDFHLYDSVNNNFKRLYLNSAPFFTVDSIGGFWIAGWNEKQGGIDRILGFDPGTEKVRSFPLDETIKIYFRGGVRPSLCFDGYGDLWLAEVNTPGLFRIKIRSGKWIHYDHDITNPESLPGNQLKSILNDSKDRLWVGTNEGISRINYSHDDDHISCINYSSKDGLIGTNITMLKEDIFGNIWAGTFNGVSILKTNGNIENLTIEDGLPSSTPRIWIIKSDGEENIYTGGTDMVKFIRSYFQENKITPSVIVSDYTVNGEPLINEEKSILFVDHIDLKHYQNFLRFEFAALNFTHPEKNRYRYILSGVDKDTVNALERNYAEYTDLRPGRYTFWVTGSNNTGLWNESGKNIAITIHPPWYRSFVAYSVYFLLFLLAGLRYRQFLINREKEKAELAGREKEMKKMQEIDEMKSRFFSNISHEFRTPLTLIIGNTDKLLENKADATILQPVYQVIRRNALRLLRLVNQLLDLSRLAVKQYKLQVSRGDIFEQIRIIVLSFTSMAERNKIRYVHDIPREKSETYFDSDVLEKVLYNLLSNAFKFTPEYGEVSVTAELVQMTQYDNPEKTARFIHIRVSDTGIGIPEEETIKIFDRFYQVDRSMHSKYEGTGVGLSLTKELLDLCHGNITVKSTPGKGSSFDLFIPVDQKCYRESELVEEKTIPEPDHLIFHEEPALIPASEFENGSGADDPVRTDSTRDLILIVEDNQDMNAYIHQHFREKYKVIRAFEGLRGTEFAEKHIPDLIITDLMMPGRDGLEMCALLKKNEKTSHIPIIMLTARASVEDKIEGLETGADDYIPKPFSLHELEVRVKNLIEQRKLLQEKFSRAILLEPDKIPITGTDEKFLQKLTKLIEKNLSSENLNVVFLSRELGFSRAQLFRKIKGLTGNTVNQLIRTYRLKKAADLIRGKYGSISEIAYAAGFNNLSYFSRCFREVYGKLPSEY